MGMHIRKDDIVEIITGDDKGKRGRVLSVDRKAGKLVVEGINRVYKHMRPSRHSPQGGRLSKEMPIDVSNVQLYCATCRRGVRMGRRYLADEMTLPVVFQWDESSHLGEGLQIGVLIRAQHRHHRLARGDQVRQELSCHPFTIHDDPRLRRFSRRLLVASQDRRQSHRQVLVA